MATRTLLIPRPSHPSLGFAFAAWFAVQSAPRIPGLPSVHNPERSSRIRSARQRPETISITNIFRCTRTPALRRRLERRDSDVRRERRHHRSGVLREPWLETFLIHIPSISNIVHIARRLAERHDEGESAAWPITEQSRHRAATDVGLFLCRYKSQGTASRIRKEFFSSFLQARDTWSNY